MIERGALRLREMQRRYVGHPEREVRMEHAGHAVHEDRNRYRWNISSQRAADG